MVKHYQSPEFQVRLHEEDKPRFLALSGNTFSTPQPTSMTVVNTDGWF